ncbi:AraC family transcriptional regulator [Methylocella tundrae]|uniref:AraC family transcriptional regulator n=1 Tax=Methylocella tundrae TaxID=227605 RepID=A0A8B6M336_METTU|nr:GyrI-like domain-containing protein [Methylocella tundrae]VTZ49437.1 AraC family transcriptional regulator [Methylocella tundrae]
MRFGEIRKPIALRLAFSLAFALLLGLFASAPGPACAEAGSAATPSQQETPASPPAPDAAAPDKAAPAPEATVPEPDQQRAAPGVPSDATAETVDVPPRPVALLVGDAEWADGFKAITTAIGKVQDAIKAAGLKQAGPPFAVFLSTDDASFHFEAMVPLAEKPGDKSDLPDGVKLGESPYGKAIKFLHRGAYDDIDSTYDLITAYLDEKGLEARNLFIEEYLTDTKESDDASLKADIYVFLK